MNATTTRKVRFEKVKGAAGVWAERGTRFLASRYVLFERPEAPAAELKVPGPRFDLVARGGRVLAANKTRECCEEVATETGRLNDLARTAAAFTARN
jgi:hypothetical protein